MDAMPNCTRCGQPITSDAKYCAHCGARLSVESMPEFVPSIHGANEVRREESIRRLLDMAFWHNDSGNTGSAMRACAAILAIDPNNVSALSLLGCLYEKQGAIDDAIEAFERVVALSPESTADAAKLDQLYSGKEKTEMTPPAAYRWIPPALVHVVLKPWFRPAAVGFAVFVAVFAVGLSVLQAIAGGGQKPIQPVVKEPVAAMPTPPVVTSAPAAAPPPAQPSLVIQPRVDAPAPPPASAAALNSAVMGPFTSPGIKLTGARQHSADRESPVAPLPAADSRDIPSLRAVKPIDMKPQAAIEETTPTPRHTVVVTAPIAPVAAPVLGESAPIAPPPPPPHIEIHFHTSQPVGAGASRIPASLSPRSSLSGKGTDYQAKALKLQNQGDYDQAVASYKKAIEAYKADLAAGRDGDFARRGIAACQTGISICNQSQ